ncbi:MAG TPA: cupin domain-containing protein [Anaerovoracaceae bacterium]|nr:cupin domain-containing protein [Anaerovoracaceae bacterium]
MHIEPMKGMKPMYRSNKTCLLNDGRYKNNSTNNSNDYGPMPFVINIDEITKQNDKFRTALWTGDYLQLTLMSIKPGEEIGLEIHPNLDQFLRIEEGQGLVRMGNRRDRLVYEEMVYDEFAIVIPAGTWHNLINTGNKPLQLYSIYAPPQHPWGTVQETKEEAMEEEEDHH